MHSLRPVEPRTDARERHDLFVGRSAELGAFDDALARVCAGERTTLLVAGEAGLGKTRLLAEFTRRTAGALFVVEARCAAHSQEPLAPLLALLERLRHDRASDRRTSRADFDETVAHLRAALTKATAKLPVALVLDDAHFSSAATLEALDHLDDVMRTLTIIAFRSEEMPLANEASLARFSARGARRITLTPLAPDETATLVRARATGRRELERREIERIVYLSGGNSGIALELATAREGEPTSIDALASRSLDALDGSTQETVIVASQLGDRFERSLLCAVLERDETTVLDALQRATLARLVRETEPGVFAFRSPAFARAIRRRASVSWAARFHRRAADLLTAAAPERFGEIARHRCRSGDPLAALIAYERAGDAEIARSDYAAAERAYRHAFDLVPHADVATRRAMALKLASALRLRGLDDEAGTSYDLALELSRSLPHTPGLPDAMLDQLRLAWANANLEAADALLAQIAALDLPDTSPVKVRAFIIRATIDALAGRVDEALALLDDVERRFPFADPAILAAYHHARGNALAMRGDFAEAERELDTSIRYVDRSHDDYQRLIMRVNVGTKAIALGQTARGAELLATACEIGRMADSKSGLVFAQTAYAEALQKAGRLRDAGDVLLEVRSADVNDNIAHDYYVAISILVGTALDDPRLTHFAQDTADLERAFANGEPQRMVLFSIAFATYYWMRDETSAARSLLSRAVAALDNAQMAYRLCTLVARIGDVDDLAKARALLERDMRGGGSPSLAAHLALFDACVMRRKGKNSSAASLGRQAAKRFHDLGWPAEEAEALEISGNKIQALDLFRAIGDVGSVARLSRPARGASGERPGHFSPREREIGDLAGTGLSNREIADRLAISVRTVEQHLQSLYRKLGVQSRYQLPAELARRFATERPDP